MKKITALVIFLSACLWAADFWQVKSFGEWSDKDVHRMIENSPWAKQYSLANTPPTNNGRGRGGGGGRSADGPIADMSQDGMGSAAGRNRTDSSDDVRGPAPVTLTIRWQAALPVKQALLRLKYGSEAATSSEAKKILENQDDAYVIGIVGLSQGLVRGVPVQIKRDLMEFTFLSSKGKDNLHPADVQFNSSASQFIDVYFLFPKKTPFTLDDKEIEFTTKFGTLVIKERFRLKDMVINGKLEL
jgi:hypothetical protein